MRRQLLRRTVRAALGALLLAAQGGAAGAAPEPYARERARMLEEIAALARETRLETGRSAFSESVMTALAKVPRHEFVPPREARNAYANRPLPIGHGQTISQPFIVALMTELMEVKPGSKVLEVGTGSGYQAAVLAELGAMVYTVDIVEPLARAAAERLARLGYRNVVVAARDGFQGWPEHAPFDAIMVTAAPREVPRPLIEQLRPGGRLVVPVGGRAGSQELRVLTKQPDGSVTSRSVLAVRFVPLVDKAGKQQ